jgi:hypothetical protein
MSTDISTADLFDTLPMEDDTTEDEWGFGGEVDETSTRVVEITPVVRKGLDRAVVHFAKPSTKVDPASSRVLSVNFKTEDEADTFRKQVAQYATEHGLYAGFPKYSPEHVSKKGKRAGEIIPANGTPKHWNVATGNKHNVTFRIVKPRETGAAAAKVTVTQGAPRAAAPSPGMVGGVSPKPSAPAKK